MTQASESSTVAPQRGEGDDEDGPTRALPRQVGPYRILNQLGHGGMGMVYLGEAPGGDHVAVKVLSALTTDPGDRRRFDREGELLEKLRHENLVGTLGRGVDQASGQAYIALELVRGRDLDQVLVGRGEGLPPDEVIYVVERCARGLAAAHAMGVIHRDLKPANVLVTADGDVKLTDFGIALDHDVSTRLTAHDEIVGTPHYVAPEVLRSDSAWSPACDVYALGALAYRLATGRPVFDRPTLVEVLEAHVRDAPLPLQERAPRLPAACAALVMRMLAKRPEERPGAAEVAEALAELSPSRETIATRWQAASLVNQRAVSARLRREQVLPQDSSFHHFRILKEIGRGGMGVVYQALHLGLRRQVALKVMLAGTLATEDERRRFLREAETAASLRHHPNLVQVLDAGEFEGTYYLVMEYVDGLPLDRYLAQHDGSVQPLLRLFLDICAGVRYAHEQGLVHRDLKPENVLVDRDGVPHVLDFGIAKQLDQDRQSRALTSEGDVLGTLRYMAPEQAAGHAKDVDARSDVYSLGTILYEMLTRTTPFTGTAREILLQLHLSEPPPPSRRRPGLPWELDAICLKALEKEPGARYPDVAAFADDVVRYLAHRPIIARQATPAYRLRKYLRRHRPQVLALALVLLVVGGLTGLWLWQLTARGREHQAAVAKAVLEGWRQFSDRRYGEAAKSFDRAHADLDWEETVELPAEARAALPPEVLHDLEAGGESALLVDKGRLQGWLVSAEERRHFELVTGLLEQARKALEEDRLRPAGEQVLRALLVSRDDGEVETLRREVLTRLLEAGERALEGASAGAGRDFSSRATALEEARPFLEQARSLASSDEELRGLPARLQEAREALEREESRAQREAEAARQRLEAQRLYEVSVAPAGGVTADGQSRAVITVQLRDPQGAPLPGRAVRLEASGAGNLIFQPDGVTDAEGLVAGAIASSVAEIKTLTVVVNPGSDQLQLHQRPTVEFVPGAPAASACSLQLSRETLPADGAAVCTLSVTVADALGNPVPGQRVELVVSGGRGELQQPGASDAAGKAVGTLTSRLAGERRVQALVNPGPGQLELAPVVLQFLPGEPDLTQSRVTATPASGLVADGASVSTITVALSDACGNPVSGRTVKLEVGGQGNLLTQPGVSDAAGLATGSLASTVAEVKSLTVVLDPGSDQRVLPTQPTVEFLPGPVEPANCTLSAAPNEPLADGASVSSLTVTVCDAHGNPVPGRRVELVVGGGGNQLEPGSGVSDAAGRVTVALRSTLAEEKTVTAVVEPGGAALRLPQPLRVRFLPGPVSPATSTVRVLPAEGVVADGRSSATVRVAVSDAQGNPVPGLSVRFDGEWVGLDVRQPEGPTDAGGIAVGSVASNVAGPRQLRVVINPGPAQVVLGEGVTIRFVPGPVDPGVSSLRVAPAAGLKADGAASSRIVLALRDAFGNALGGVRVELQVEGEGAVLSQRVGVTDGTGSLRAQLSATGPGVKRVSAWAVVGEERIRLLEQPTVEFVAP